ncbi:unnamed protein product [Microthlaspi erraticum]|uniref:Zinc knuckle CX2CX4HX4C domain-containing protein n=1 Tax=Microthlaspi erraticum TaxID=1685480 RepID=A0A6D2IRY5_9BRAS|nr:unnamed protein product [Microthlaspi erraticum]
MAPPPRKRIRARAPELDTTDLVHQNSLTLIGRLTNPQEQRMWTMIPYISSRWELQGRAVGSDLGLPLHYWKKELLSNIGKEIGDYKEQLLTNLTAKIKVEINGLQPLVKDVITEFEGGQEALVTFEYENLGKHCSYCYSLSDEVETCLEKPSTRLQKEGPARSTERDRHLTSKAGKLAEQRPFNLRRDRHGRPFGVRPSSKRMENVRPTEPDHPRNLTVEPLQTRRQQPPNISPPYKRNRLDPSTHQSRHDQEPARTDPGLGHPEASRRPKLLNTPTRQIWREKPPSLVDQTDDISTTLLPIQITGRNLEIEAFTPPERIRSEADIMSSLQEVTVQYTNVDDPIERAARTQRVLEGEARGLMTDSARSIFNAQTSQQHNVIPSSGEKFLIILLEGGDERTDNQLPTHTQEKPRRPRGRPPTKKPNQNINATEAGPSKRKGKQSRISPFLRISPLPRIIQTRTPPVSHNHGTRRNRVTLHRGATGPATPSSVPLPTTIIPATRKAMRKVMIGFVCGCERYEMRCGGMQQW